MLIEMMISIVLAQRPITIIYDNSPKSRMLVAELKRDWTKYDFPLQQYCVDIQKQYKNRLKFIDADDYKNSRYRLDKYPGIMYGVGRPEYLDERAIEPTHFLFAFHTYISNIEADLTEFRAFVNTYDTKYRYKVEMFLLQSHTLRFNDFMQKHYGFEYDEGFYPDLEALRSEFRDVKFPPRDPLPEFPIKLNPWDYGFKEELESGKFVKSVLK